MFTGIIEEVGQITQIRLSQQGGQLQVNAYKILENIKLGDSIAVNGVCLTVIGWSRNNLQFDVSGETGQRTSLRWLRNGAKVNLERALRLTDRLGGHIVQGHVDATGEFHSSTSQGASSLLCFRYPAAIAPYICAKGSIAIEGVSLTIADYDAETLTVAVVPHTLQHTTLQDMQSGQPVNLEADVLAKYLERLLQVGRITTPAELVSEKTLSDAPQSTGLTWEKLQEMGY
jgi:riboflavin synthase